MLDQYESHYAGWNVKHFHEHLQLAHGRPLELQLGQDEAAGGRTWCRGRRRGSSSAQA